MEPTTETPATPETPVLTAKSLMEKLEEMGRAVNALQTEVVPRAEAETKTNGGPAPETKESIEKLNDALDRLEAMKTQFELQQLRAARAEQLPSEGKALGPATVDMEAKEAAAYEVAYNTFLRQGPESLSREQVGLLKKAFSTDMNASGGYITTRTIDTNIRQKLIEFSPLRELADVETISGASWEGPAEGEGDFEAGWVGERSPRPETGTPPIRLDRIPVHEMYANPHATQTMLDDASFAMEPWIVDRLVRRFRVIEGIAFISGDGNHKPEGILTNTQIPTVVSGHATQVTADGWINFLYDLPEFYNRGATIITRRATVRATRLLKDGQQQYIWQPGLQVGMPSTILEHNYREDPYMPAIGAGAKVAAVGAWKIGYKIVDRRGVQTLRDPYTAKPFVGFYTTKRVGGGVIMPEALRTMTISA